MSAMNFEYLEARLQGSFSGILEVLHHFGNLVRCQFLWQGVVFGEAFGAGGDSLPAPMLGGKLAAAAPRAISTGLAACVRELDAWDSSLLFDKSGDACEHGNMFIVINTQVLW